ncbi:MAG: hypothetical protein SGILL_008094, partial [Bacillariaceae sp.]
MSSAMDEEKAAGIMKDSATAEDNKDMVVVQGDEYVQHDAPKRKGHICCGCCCDTRKAVFAVNVVSLCLYGLGLMSVSGMIAAKNRGSFDDDAVNDALNSIDGVQIGLSFTFILLGMIFNGIALYGASNFHRYAVLAGGLWFVFETVRSLVYMDIAGAIMAALFTYPHAMLYNEIKKGIM